MKRNPVYEGSTESLKGSDKSKSPQYRSKTSSNVVQWFCCPLLVMCLAISLASVGLSIASYLESKNVQQQLRETQQQLKAENHVAGQGLNNCTDMESLCKRFFQADTSEAKRIDQLNMSVNTIQSSLHFLSTDHNSTRYELNSIQSKFDMLNTSVASQLNLLLSTVNILNTTTIEQLNNLKCSVSTVNSTINRLQHIMPINLSIMLLGSAH